LVASSVSSCLRRRKRALSKAASEHHVAPAAMPQHAVDWNLSFPSAARSL
jgi:hypothetical protein